MSEYFNSTLQELPNKDLYSKELLRLLENSLKYATEEDNIPVITVEYLIERTLEYQKDSFLYRSLNSVMSVFSIEGVMERISSSEMFDYGVVRPGSVAKFSPDVLNYLQLSNTEREKMRSKLITSDHVLLAIISENENNVIKSAILETGGNYDAIFSASEKLHDITSELADIDLEAETDTPENVESKTEEKPEKHSKNAEKVKLKIDSIINDRNSHNSNVSFCRHLNNMASNGQFDEVIGREKEINKIEKVLARRVCNNVVLVGKSGCGKTAIVNGLARMIYEQKAPLSLLNKTIYALDIMTLVGGTTLRGMLQERIVKLFRDLSAINGAILFLDDIHSYDGAMEDVKTVSQLMTAINQNPNIPVIMTTTEDGYRNLTNNNPDIRRRFQRINIEELSEENTQKAISYLVSVYEDFHKIKYDPAAINLCIGLAKRYISERALPSSAIDIIDEAGAKKKLEIAQPPELTDILKEIIDVKQLIKNATQNDDIELRDSLYTTLDGLRIKANDIIDTKKDGIVTEADMYAAVAEHTGIPVSKLNVSEKKQLAKIEDIMKERIIGQDEAIKNVANAIKRNKAGLYKRSKPLYSAFFDGVTGVGKSLTAKVLAEEVFGDEKYLIRFDMSEYSDKTAVNKLIGTGSGYIGYDNGGLLTEAVKNKKYAVLLFDEIEKADDSVYNIMLQILDEAQVTDNMGNKVDFKNTIVLFTSNVGAKKALYEKSIGFGYDKDNSVAEGNSLSKEVLEKELKKEFPPEFLNRLDNIVYFNKLSDDNMKEIIKLELNKCKKRIEEAGYSFEYDDSTVSFIFDDIQSEKEYGARPILRSIEKNIENEVSDIIISEDELVGFKTFVEGEKLVVEFKRK